MLRKTANSTSVEALIGWFAVLFTGAWPQGMRGFLVQVSNGQTAYP